MSDKKQQYTLAGPFLPGDVDFLNAYRGATPELREWFKRNLWYRDHLLLRVYIAIGGLVDPEADWRSGYAPVPHPIPTKSVTLEEIVEHTGHLGAERLPRDSKPRSFAFQVKRQLRVLEQRGIVKKTEEARHGQEHAA